MIGIWQAIIKLAKEGIVYDSSSTQVDLPEDLAKQVIEWGKANIPEKCLHNDGENSKGLEDEIHCTILYGLNTRNPQVIGNALKGTVKPFNVRLGLIDGFQDNKKYDVLKINVECPELIKLHYLLDKRFPNKNSFPTYSPHITIAYLKKGCIDKWLGNETFRGKEFPANGITFSPSGNGERQIIPISG